MALSPVLISVAATYQASTNIVHVGNVWLSISSSLLPASSLSGSLQNFVLLPCRHLVSRQCSLHIRHFHEPFATKTGPLDPAKMSDKLTR